MFLNPFDGPRAKIARGKRHFDELRDAERRYSAEQPVQVTTRLIETGETLLLLKVSSLPSLDDASIVADILGNFRSSLDLAVCEACRIDGAEDVRHTYFHFASTETEWDKSVKGRMKAAGGQLRSVVRGLRPWQGGNNLLYALSKLAAADKHQLLVPVGAQASMLQIDGLRFSREDGGRTRFDGQVPVWSYEQNEAVFGKVGEGSKIEVSGPSILNAMFAFGDVDCVANEPVIVLLNQMGRMCEDIVDVIEAYSATA